MRKKWIKRIIWVVLSPVLLFLVVMVLFYLPPVQNYLRQEATAYASKVTGMQITIGRLDLRFPLNLLVTDVSVIHQPDTLLSLERLDVRVEALPLLKGRIEIENVTLDKVFVNSGDYLKGVKIKGMLGRFFLKSRGIDFKQEFAAINEAELSNTHMQVVLNDTTAKDTTKQAPLNWRLALHRLKLDNVSFSLQLPNDSVGVAAHLKKTWAFGAKADLKQSSFRLDKLLCLNAAASYVKGLEKAEEGFDPAHIALKKIHLELDSLTYRAHDISAVIRRWSMTERSGLSVTSLVGQLHSNRERITIPYLKLRTPHSTIDLEASARWDSILTFGAFHTRLEAYLGREDVMLFVGGLPNSFKQAYPFRPLVFRAGIDGTLKEMRFSTLSAELPGAFSFSGEGGFQNITDSLNRTGVVTVKMTTGDLNFLTALTGQTASGTLAIPDSMQLDAHLTLRGSQFQTKVLFREGEGLLKAQADVNTTTEAYQTHVEVDRFHLQHFFPKDSIYELSFSASAHGRGFNLLHARSQLTFRSALEELHYGSYRLSDVTLNGEIRSGVAQARLISDNSLLKMKSDATYHLNNRYPTGKLTVNVLHLNLYELGLLSAPLKHPFGFKLSAEVDRKQIHSHLTSGDMSLELHSGLGVYPLMKQSTRFTQVLLKQIDQKVLNHEQLRKVLPTIGLSLSAGKQNPLAYYLETKEMSFKDLSVSIGSQSGLGINGRAAIHDFRMDTLKIDTIFCRLSQDTTSLRLTGGLVNASRNPQLAFRATLAGEIGTNQGQLMLEYLNGKGEKGVHFGVKARPLVGGRSGKRNGLVFNLIPEEPIVAFRKFHFENKRNWIYLHQNKRVYAFVDMVDDEGMGLHVHSVREDSVSLQNINVELSRIRLGDLSRVLPYLPNVSGLFSADAHYIQTDKTLQVSAEAVIDELAYEKRRIGDVTLGVTWLPGEFSKQYLSSYLTHEGEEIMTADGTLIPGASDKNTHVDVNAVLHHFPLSIANAFVPDRLVDMGGDVDGELNLTGQVNHPLLNGELILDSVSAFSPQTGARFLFDNRPVQMKNNRLSFDRFAIYTTGKNPFTIDGFVDFHEPTKPVANFKLFAENYLLLNAKRTRESLAYGRVLVDFNSTVRGPLTELKMRGNMNILGSTDLTYIMKDSPLIVQDRLGSLVTFTSFKDSTLYAKEEAPAISLGGMDVVMTMHVDPSVRLRADLSADRNNRIELEGGGDLVLKYTPQGDVMLSGRYQLSGGLMKYALPVIPLKEFKINDGSYLEWTGNPMNPTLNFKATERMRASVSDGEDTPSRMVNFDVSVIVKQKLDDLYLAFDLDAPEDAAIQNQLAVMGREERGKQAIALMVTGLYMGNGLGGSNQGGLNLNMGSALNSVLSSQINSLVGNLKNANLSFGMEEHQVGETGGKTTDYSFRYSQRLFNDRFLIVLGGKVSTGANAANSVESFIDNVSLEYRLDNTGTRSVRLFYDKNYESLLEGEITEAGVGVVLRKKLDNLGELFIFRKKKKKKEN